jgi:hypothetical protein
VTESELQSAKVSLQTQADMIESLRREVVEAEKAREGVDEKAAKAYTDELKVLDERLLKIQDEIRGINLQIPVVAASETAGSEAAEVYRVSVEAQADEQSQNDMPEEPLPRLQIKKPTRLSKLAKGLPEIVKSVESFENTSGDTDTLKLLTMLLQARSPTATRERKEKKIFKAIKKTGAEFSDALEKILDDESSRTDTVTAPPIKVKSNKAFKSIATNTLKSVATNTEARRSQSPTRQSPQKKSSRKTENQNATKPRPQMIPLSSNDTTSPELTSCTSHSLPCSCPSYNSFLVTRMPHVQPAVLRNVQLTRDAKKQADYIINIEKKEARHDQSYRRKDKKDKSMSVKSNESMLFEDETSMIKSLAEVCMEIENESGISC